jgi:flagellar protein FlaI
MLDDKLLKIEDQVMDMLAGKFNEVTDLAKRRALVKFIAKTVEASLSEADIDAIFKDMNDLGAVSKLVSDDSIEDIMINNTENIFINSGTLGDIKIEDRMHDREELNRMVKRIRLYATNEEYKGNIFDIHLPSGSRANVVNSPKGYNVTIRNFKSKTLSILDIINTGFMSYEMAARMWLYVDGLKIRPANILIGGIPGAGKTTLLNSMFSFFRPDERIITIEETYELNTATQENCVNLETSEDVPMEALVKTALRMRPDMIIIGEVRGAEANDMITAMNIGKIAMGTIHASTSRDIINRLEHTPMNVPMDIIPVIDVLIVVSMIRGGNNVTPVRRITQVSEISGIETNVLLSDLYKFDYKTMRGSAILPSVTYRDMLAKLAGVAPPDILGEERVRAAILERLNSMGKRDIKSISQIVKDYYYEPDNTLKKLDLKISPVIRI